MKQCMKNVVLGSSTLLAIGATGHVAEAATTADITIEAVVLAPVSITADATGLNFGSLTVGATSGVVTVDLNDTITAATGSVNTFGGAETSGGFTLKGTSGATVQVTASATSVILTSGGDTMTVNGFQVGGGPGAVGSQAFPLTRVLGAATETGYDVGGTLNVSAAQPAGTYSGSLTLTVAYQ